MNKDAAFLPKNPAPCQEVQLPAVQQAGVRLFIKREDLLHPYVSGNKWRKLGPNLQQALAGPYKSVASFGGAFSNHVYALAAACQALGLPCHGFIRGEEHLPLNPTLAFARQNGMQLHYVSRGQYRQKETAQVQTALAQQLPEAHKPVYWVPEGGTNALAVQGCMDIVNEIEMPFNVLTCAVGSGGTMAGLVAAAPANAQVLGFAALKNGHFLNGTVQALVQNHAVKAQWQIETNWHFGGYAKANQALVNFIRQFYAQTQIPLEPVYTGKMLYGLLQHIDQGAFAPGTHIVAVHTGGLQGIRGFNQRYPQWVLPLP